MFKSKYTLPTHGLSLSLSLFIRSLRTYIYIIKIMFRNRIRFIFRNIVPFSKNNLCVCIYIYTRIFWFAWSQVNLLDSRERERAKIRSMFHTALKNIFRSHCTTHSQTLVNETPCSPAVYYACFCTENCGVFMVGVGGEDKVWIFFNGETAKTLVVLCDEQMSRENFQYFPSYMSSIWRCFENSEACVSDWYCWWKKSQTTTWDVYNLVNNGIFTNQLVQEFFHLPYHYLCLITVGMGMLTPDVLAADCCYHKEPLILHDVGTCMVDGQVILRTTWNVWNIANRFITYRPVQDVIHQKHVCVCVIISCTYRQYTYLLCTFMFAAQVPTITDCISTYI